MKICPVGAELFHADRRTDMLKLISLFAILQTPLKICISIEIYTAIVKQMDAVCKLRDVK